MGENRKNQSYYYFHNTSNMFKIIVKKRREVVKLIIIHSRWKTRITINEEVYNRYRFFVNCTKYANVKEINKLTDVDIRFIVLETYRKMYRKSATSSCSCITCFATLCFTRKIIICSIRALI